MPIPEFTPDGVLPPFVGAREPGGHAGDMSPYTTTALEVAASFGGTPERQVILRGWLAHRAAMRAVGFDRGFQWLDGSFVEDKQPHDLDVVTFLYRPEAVSDPAALAAMMRTNPDLFQRQQVSQKYSVDFFPIDLNGSPEGIVGLTQYFLGLFSHRRRDNLWKGMVQVRLENANDDNAALAALELRPTQQERNFR